MIKIMLVEDDKSLREIYDVRLRAEGYDIKYAGDGEEALAMAVKEHPDLIISDVMMPKISGFDMLDILRATPETKAIKVIMMTALSSEDQRARGESLGADRYLVKSQVGIEDVVRTVHEVLEDMPNAAPAQPARPTFTPGVLDPSIVPQTTYPTPPVQTAPVAPVAAPTMQPVMQSFATEGAFTQTPAFATSMAQPEAQPEIQPFYPPQPQFQAPVELAAQSAIQPEQFIEPAQQFAPAPTTTIRVVDQSQPVQLPQPTAPFSTPAPTSLVEELNTINASPAMTLDQALVDNNATAPQNNIPIS
jgi:CheY-like chemotaxis protein